jgi:hypothetical protein
MERMIRAKQETAKAPIAADHEKDERQRGRYVAAVGTAGTVLGLLIAIGWAFLPVTTLLEKTLVLLACCALSLASWIGFGAWHSAARFTFVAVAGGVAIICLGGLSVAAHTDLGNKRAQASGIPQPTAAAHGQRRLRPSASGAPSSPVTSSPSRGASTTQKSLYLAALTGTISQNDTQAAAPEVGSAQLGTMTYPQSLTYTADNNLCDSSQSVTYSFGSSYQSFVATVGVSDVPGDADAQGVVVSFEVDNGSGSQLGAASAQYGQPALIHANIQGATSITLITSSSIGCFGGGSAKAVWGNAQLVP